MPCRFRDICTPTRVDRRTRAIGADIGDVLYDLALSSQRIAQHQQMQPETYTEGRFCWIFGKWYVARFRWLSRLLPCPPGLVGVCPVGRRLRSHDVSHLTDQRRDRHSAKGELLARTSSRSALGTTLGVA